MECGFSHQITLIGGWKVHFSLATQPWTVLCKAAKQAPVFLHLKNWNKIQAETGTVLPPDPKCPVPLWITSSPHYNLTLRCQLKKITRSYGVLPKGLSYHRILFFIYINYQNPMRITVRRFPSNSSFAGAYGKHNITVQWPRWYKGTMLCFSVDSYGGHSNSSSLGILALGNIW